jgi:hypothetical protein
MNSVKFAHSIFTNKSTLPAATLVRVVRLANPNFLLEVEVIGSCGRKYRRRAVPTTKSIGPHAGAE